MLQMHVGLTAVLRPPTLPSTPIRLSAGRRISQIHLKSSYGGTESFAPSTKCRETTLTDAQSCFKHNWNLIGEQTSELMRAATSVWNGHICFCLSLTSCTLPTSPFIGTLLGVMTAHYVSI